MPVAHFYVTSCTPEQEKSLLTQGSRQYADVLGAPLERVRIFLHRCAPTSVAVAGVPVADGGMEAPYFDALVLAGRPVAHRHQLLAALTDVCVEVFGVERSLVRGMVIEVDPDHWGIGGVPAAVVRAEEIARRAEAATTLVGSVTEEALR